MGCKCDFLEFTVPADRQADLVASIPGGLVQADRGFRGYSHSAILAGGKGRLGWSPDRPEMGVHCSLGGQALDVLGALDAAWADRSGVVGLVQDGLGGHVTRFDAAWDDLDGALDLDVVEAALDAGEFTSRWKRGYRVKGFQGFAGPGRTFYLGSGKSDAMLLIYDKAAERAAAGVEFQGDHWVRVELRLRRERANTAAAVFKSVTQNAAAAMAHLAGVLRGYIEFKTPDASDSNKRRWAVAPWWSAFLGHVEKARLTVGQAELRTLDDVKAWVARQVGPSLALLQEAMGFEDAWAFLFAEAKDGRERWNAKHLAIIAASAG